MNNNLNKIERFFQFVGSVGIIVSVPALFFTIQRNSESDISSARQILSLDKSGNFGRAQALNTLASSHCLIKYGSKREIDSFSYGRAQAVPQCRVSGGWFIDGPQSMFGLNLSSGSDGVSIFDRLILSSVDLKNSLFEGVLIRNSTVANSALADASIRGSFVIGSKFIGNDLNSFNMDCAYISRTTFHENLINNSTINFSKLIFVSIDSFGSKDIKETSQNISINDSVLLDSNIDLSSSYNVRISRTKIIRSDIKLKDAKQFAAQDSDLSYSKVSGNVVGNEVYLFRNVNLTGVDLEDLDGLSPSDIENNFYCNGRPPKLPASYDGPMPKERKCGGDIPPRVEFLLTEVTRRYFPVPSLPLEAYYVSTDQEENAKQYCGNKKTAVEKFYGDSGVLLIKKGYYISFFNVSSKTAISQNLNVIGTSRGAETSDLNEHSDKQEIPLDTKMDSSVDIDFYQ